MTCPCGTRRVSGVCKKKCKLGFPWRERGRIITVDTPAKVGSIEPLRQFNHAPREFTGSIPKDVPWRSDKYTEFIRAKPCCVRHTPGPSDPHHEQKEGHGGTATKAGDERQVPLRHDLHVELETPGNSRKACWARWGVDPEKVIAELHQEWFEKTGSYPGHPCQK